MPIVRLALKCLFGILLGASLGLAMLFFGSVEQGIGLAIAGGIIGLLISLSTVWYQTSTGDTISRSLSLFGKVMVKYNLPFIDDVVQLDYKPVGLRDGKAGDPARVWRRMQRGGTVAGVVLQLPAVVTAYLLAADAEPAFVGRIFLAIVILLLLNVVAFLLGAGIGGLTVSGVHRRNIIVGTLAGLAIGAGLATAISPGAREPTSVFLTVVVVFGVLGLACGVFTPENFTGESRE